MQALPRIRRAQVIEACAALGLDDDAVSSVQITGTEVEVGLFVFNDDGSPLFMHGEVAQVYVTVPVEED